MRSATGLEVGRIARILLVAGGLLVATSMPGQSAVASPDGLASHMQRAKVFLAAGDYRRALEACQRQVDEAPSAKSYLFLTYIYAAIDGYLEYLSKEDKWVSVEHLYINLSGAEAQSLLDPPDVLARIAKEIIQNGARRQYDVHAAMAARLDADTTNRLWKEQAVWRTSHPDNWWSGVPESWGW